MLKYSGLSPFLQKRRLISSDSHIIEPPDLWVTRIDKVFRDKVPQVRREGGTDWWFYKGQKIGSISGRKKRAGSIINQTSIESDGAVLTHSVFENVIEAAYTPSLYLDEMRRDHVVGSVIRPTQGITNYCVSDDPELFGAMCRTYNDWIYEFCSADSAALKAIAMLNNYNVDEAVAELERCAKRGFVGGIISVYPGADQHYGLHKYDRLYAAAQHHAMPLSLHVLTNYNGPYGVNFSQVNYSLRANADYWVRMSFSDLIFSGVFDRYPDLIFESSEHEAGWVPYFKWQLNWIYENRILKRQQANTFTKPIEKYFNENFLFSIIYDPLAISQRAIIGTDKIMWGSDFPHEQSSHPNSLLVVEELFSGVSDSDIEKMTLRNAAQSFKFDLTHPSLNISILK